MILINFDKAIGTLIFFIRMPEKLILTHSPDCARGPIESPS